MSQIDKYSEKTFEDIKHFTEDGTEFWYARELQEVLEYTEWRNFSKVINKAKQLVKTAILIYQTILLTLTKWFNLTLVLKGN